MHSSLLWDKKGIMLCVLFYKLFFNHFVVMGSFSLSAPPSLLPLRAMLHFVGCYILFTFLLRIDIYNQGFPWTRTRFLFFFLSRTLFSSNHTRRATLSFFLLSLFFDAFQRWLGQLWVLDIFFLLLSSGKRGTACPCCLKITSCGMFKDAFVSDI